MPGCPHLRGDGWRSQDRSRPGSLTDQRIPGYGGCPSPRIQFQVPEPRSRFSCFGGVSKEEMRQYCLHSLSEEEVQGSSGIPLTSHSLMILRTMAHWLTCISSYSVMGTHRVVLLAPLSTAHNASTTPTRTTDAKASTRKTSTTSRPAIQLCRPSYRPSSISPRTRFPSWSNRYGRARA